MSIEAMKQALEAAYLAGFNASGEGYNGEYPFGDKNQNPEHDSVWCKDRDNALEEALAKQGEPDYKTLAIQLQQQRTWVGLTDVERSQLVILHHGWNEYGKAIEAKLKEKNT
jgi:hypothetical protein